MQAFESQFQFPCLKAPVTLYRIASERRDFCTGLDCYLHYATVIRYVPQSKNHSALLVLGGMKSNPVCTMLGNAKCNQQIRYDPVQ